MSLFVDVCNSQYCGQFGSFEKHTPSHASPLPRLGKLFFRHCQADRVSKFCEGRLSLRYHISKEQKERKVCACQKVSSQCRDSSTHKLYKYYCTRRRCHHLLYGSPGLPQILAQKETHRPFQGEQYFYRLTTAFTHEEIGIQIANEIPPRVTFRQEKLWDSNLLSPDLLCRHTSSEFTS